MFGYVRICKDAMNNDDYETFRAYYCGLCKAIGKYSHAARLGLSYDMTFLFVLLSAIYKDEKKASCRCALHPFKKEYKIENDDILEYVSGISVLLLFRKLEDDKKDDGGLKPTAACAACRHGFKKASAGFPDKDKTIYEYINRLSALEAENCTEIDTVADAFAKICESIFVPEFISDENTRKVLAWLGYNVGRWIYIVDAFDDLDDDIKKKSYNPFSGRVKNGEKISDIASELDLTLTYTMSSIAAAYDLLDIKKNDNILKNIIYVGMGNMQAKVLKTQEVDDGSL